MIPGGAQLSGHLQLVATIASLFLLLVVLDLVRRRRLFERYAILWLLSALVLIGLAIWSGALNIVSRSLGIAYPPTALFVIALGFVLVLLLHFSVAVSRLSDQSKVLAQRLALLEERLRHVGEQESGQEAEGEQPEPEPKPVPLHERAAAEAPPQPRSVPLAGGPRAPTG